MWRFGNSRVCEFEYNSIFYFKVNLNTHKLRFYTQTGINTMVHLGGKPIKFNFDGKIEIKSIPKEVIIYLKMHANLAA